MSSIDPSSIDPESAAEFDAIKLMLHIAQDNGLLAEVVWSFGNERRSGVEVREAARCAMEEWDI